MAIPRSHNPAARWTWCAHCEHRGYLARADAKKVRKRHQIQKSLAVFPCPHTAGLYHVGHRPAALSDGTIDRRTLAESQRTALQESLAPGGAW